MTDLDQFRQETRAWLEENCPESMRQPVKGFDDVYSGGRNPEYEHPDEKLWCERMAERGWTVPQWPREYGGGGLSKAEDKVLREEMLRIGARTPLFSFGISMLGPALMKFGSEEQKLEHLPKICRGEIRWCQGYSEPNAGSDLASLQTRAEDQGDHYLINGQKVWTSYADKADWIFCLVRTDNTGSKHEGISFVLFDMDQPGVTVKPIKLISGEAFRNGDRARALIRDVRHETRGPQVFLSRTAPEFLAELFKMEVPEIYDGIIEIKAVARDPGSRAKMGVISYDNSIDPVGACVGMRGSRVQAVVGELQGEKIDIIPWNEDPATFLVNALQPAEVSKVVFDDESERIEVVVPDEQLSLAIGRRGQNVRLASQLTGFDIDILTEAQESERRQAEFAERTQMFMDNLNVDEMVAQLLVAEGFTTLEEVAYVESDELSGIDGFDEATAEELQARARESLEELNAKALEKARALGVEEALIEFEGLTPQMIGALAEDGIKTLEEFATCADWELAGGYTTVDGKRVKDDGLLEKFDVGLAEAQHLVMTARVLLGWVDPAELEAARAAAEAGEDAGEADDPDAVLTEEGLAAPAQGAAS